MSTVSTIRTVVRDQSSVGISYVVGMDCGHTVNVATLGPSPVVGNSYECLGCQIEAESKTPHCVSCGENVGALHHAGCMKFDGFVKPEQCIPQLSFEALRAANVERVEQKFHPGGVNEWSPERWGLATIGEAGEVLEAVLAFMRSATLMGNSLKKLIRGDGNAAAVGREVADTIIYGDLLLARLGLDTGTCVRETFNAKSDEIGSSIRL